MRKSYAILTGAILLLGLGAAYWLGARSTETSVVAQTSARKILYYRNPMGLPDTSPVPKKDAMGMDYIPVYEGDEPENPGLVSLTPERIQTLGVKTETVAQHAFSPELRAAGQIEINERLSYVIAPKFGGWIERLYADTTGQAVRKGEALFEVYSPELLSAQQEHALAQAGVREMKGADEPARAGALQLLQSSAARLKNWDMSNVRASGNRMVFHAPANGVVLEKRAIQGMKFMPGETLYRMADLSSVWAVAEIAEQDAGQVHTGDSARILVTALPGEAFEGKVDFIYPVLNPATRTVRVRLEIANPQGLLKPAMFVQAELTPQLEKQALAIPVSAVIDDGMHQTVLVRIGKGRFEPRQVGTGQRDREYIEITAGLSEGEVVVTRANFLLDSESNLRAALGNMSPAGAAQESSEQDKPRKAEASHAKPAASVGHVAAGVLHAINDDGSVSVTHDPIASLKWPGMTMDFELANAALAANLKPGSAIEFEIVERAPGEWVITHLQAKTGEAAHAEHPH